MIHAGLNLNCLGFRTPDGNFDGWGSDGVLWSCDTLNDVPILAYDYMNRHFSRGVLKNKKAGFSVRLVKNI